MLPYNLSGLFAPPAWRRPEMYLESEVRAGISSFALADPNLIQQGVSSLAPDLTGGVWNAKYREIRKLTKIDDSYCFLGATMCPGGT